MNVGIIMFQNMRYAPYLKLYERILSQEDVPYEIIYFNRDENLHEENDDKHIPIKWYGKGTLAAPKHEKLLNFFMYRMNLLSLLKRKQFTHLIILTTFPAVLISNYLEKQYKNKYVVDIRDYTQEHNATYYAMESRAIRNSAFTIISSSGFTHFLPKFDYIMCHNVSQDAYLIKCAPLSKATNRRIIISYIGTISYEKQCLELISLVEDDERFEFHFYGNEANGNTISSYIKKRGNMRIKMMGAFMPDQKAQIYADSDIIFNCYGNDSNLVRFAISNKYYDGALYGKPLIVTPDTSMSQESGSFAYPLDLGRIDSLDGLFQWYHALNAEDFGKYAQNVIDHSILENVNMERNVVKFIRNQL